MQQLDGRTAHARRDGLAEDDVEQDFITHAELGGTLDYSLDSVPVALAVSLVPAPAAGMAVALACS